nr:hypothetical protein [Tanacetum cinerariifolium]
MNQNFFEPNPCYEPNSSRFDQYHSSHSFVTQQLPQRSNENIKLEMAKLIKNNRIVLNDKDFPHEEASMEVLLAKEIIIKLIQAWDEKQIESWSFPELLPQFLNDSRTIEQAANLAIKYVFTKPEEIPELMCKLLEDVRNIRVELAVYINSPSWNRPTFFDNYEEDSILYKEYLEKSFDAITPILPTEEPEYSLSMGYEHLNTIPETESDEVTKSSAKNLLPIPREIHVLEELLVDDSIPIPENESSDFEHHDDPLFPHPPPEPPDVEFDFKPTSREVILAMMNNIDELNEDEYFDPRGEINKLKMLKRPLRKLLFDGGNLHDNVNRLRAELDQVQSDLDADPYIISLREVEAAYVVAFNKSTILLKRVFVSHYVNFLGEAGHTSGFDGDDLFQSRLADQDALNMVHPISRQEVKDAMFAMGNDKSPGPDGYSAAFFKEAWDIVEKNVIDAVSEFFINGKILKKLNHTIIALFPKVKSLARVNDYRLISCCNVIFKCISKIIANRIKDNLKVIVSSNQLAFVPGRNISDNILLTQDLMHNYHLNRGTPRCAFKVDIQKTYDTVDWDFLQMILVGFGFHPRMITWIMECVSTTSFSLSINGSFYGYFKGKRGLRQGDPLSPYLFTLVMEILTLMFKRKEVLEEFTCASGFVPSLSKRIMRKGKANVAWEDVCRLKKEGGLGLRRLDKFNKALMISRKILQLRPVMRDFIWCKIDDGVRVSMWFDRWNDMCPLANHISTRDIFHAGFNLSTKVHELVLFRAWNWPREWYNKYQFLSALPAPDISNNVQDLLEWRLPTGKVLPFSIQLWIQVKKFACMNNMVPMLNSICSYLIPIAQRRSTRCVIAKLIVVAFAYFIWQERNWRLFKNKKRSTTQVIECIMSSVRLKLLSCRFKKSKDGVMFAQLWDLPESVFISS